MPRGQKQSASEMREALNQVFLITTGWGTFETLARICHLYYLGAGGFDMNVYLAYLGLLMITHAFGLMRILLFHEPGKIKTSYILVDEFVTTRVCVVVSLWFYTSGDHGTLSMAIKCGHWLPPAWMVFSLLRIAVSDWRMFCEEMAFRPMQSCETTQHNRVALQEQSLRQNFGQPPPTHLNASKHTYTGLKWHQDPVTGAKKVPRIAFPAAKPPQQLVRDSDDRTCGYCLDEYKAGDFTVLLPCSHRYHQECLEKWFKEKFTCPYCQRGFKWALALENDKAILEESEG